MFNLLRCGSFESTKRGPPFPVELVVPPTGEVSNFLVFTWRSALVVGDEDAVPNGTNKRRPVCESLIRLLDLCAILFTQVCYFCHVFISCSSCLRRLVMKDFKVVLYSFSFGFCCRYLEEIRGEVSPSGRRVSHAPVHSLQVFGGCRCGLRSNPCTSSVSDQTRGW